MVNTGLNLTLQYDEIREKWLITGTVRGVRVWKEFDSLAEARNALDELENNG